MKKLLLTHFRKIQWNFEKWKYNRSGRLEKEKEKKKEGKEEQRK